MKMAVKVRNVNPMLLMIILLGVFMGLAVFSEVWLWLVGKNPLGNDFYIYYEALGKAQARQNPYQPLEIGVSFLYHPFALTFLSLFAPFEYRTALTLWLFLGVVAWGISFYVLMKLTRQAASEARQDLLQQRWFIVVVGLVFFSFAPFWENLHVSQINTFVILALVLSFYFSETNHLNWAGVWLAIAVALKTSPIILLLYFATVRKYRVIFVCIISLSLLTLLPLAQFGWLSLNGFIEIIPLLSAKVHLSLNNQSIIALAYRAIDTLTGITPGDGWAVIQRLAMVSLSLLFFWVGFTKTSNTKSFRFCLYGAFVTTMTLSSPLVWYHHSMFLLIPLLSLLSYNKPFLVHWALIIVFAIQMNRVFEFVVERYALLVLLAHLCLIGLMIRIALENFKKPHHLYS